MSQTKAQLIGGVGISTAEGLVVSGVVTATSFVGNIAGTATTSTYSTSSGIATYATTAGVSTVSQGLTGTPNITVNQLTATTISAGSTTGTLGQVLQSTGTGIGWTTTSGGITQLDNVIGYNSAGARSDPAYGRLEVFGVGNFRVFTSPGTFTVNPGISSIRVRVIGAGGNGGGVYGGGGGGGGYAHKVITSPSFPAPGSYTVTVGSAPGGTSSFGPAISATGGSNGSQPAGGGGGSGSGGDVNYSGATGSSGSPGNTFGNGGASGSQLGNSTQNYIPGISQIGSSKPISDDRFFVERFPFDIFIGQSGIPIGPAGVPAYTPTRNATGSGGGGGNGWSPSVPGSDGGSGGVGGGGGGGNPLGGRGGYGGGGGAPNGAGGPGIVIVEW